MGREAHCAARWANGSGEVRALLESDSLILRGALARRLAIGALRDVRVDGDDLVLQLGTERIALGLGAAVAARWALKIATPPPSLRHKLGLSGAARARVVGTVTDAALAEALDGVTAGAGDMSVAVVEDAAALDAALAAHGSSAGPIWIVHRKGKGAVFGEAAVRAALRGRGFVDTKVTAVSAAFTATRYNRRP